MNPVEKEKKHVKENIKNYAKWSLEKKTLLEEVGRDIVKKYPNLKLSYVDSSTIHFEIFGGHVYLEVYPKDEKWMTFVKIGSQGVYHTERDMWESISQATRVAEDFLNNMCREFRFALEVSKV